MSLENSLLVPGLQDQVTGGQVIFRSALKAMSEPGTVVDISQDIAVEPLSPAMYAVILALLDQQTSLWLAKSFDQPQVVKNLQFHTGVKLAKTAQEAQFALAMASEIDELERFNIGTDESPEMSCSLFLQVDSISIDENISDSIDCSVLALSGPGIETIKNVGISKLSKSLIDYLTERSGEFPKGLDCYFVSQNQLLCIPRTTQVKVI